MICHLLSLPVRVRNQVIPTIFILFDLDCGITAPFHMKTLDIHYNLDTDTKYISFYEPLSFCGMLHGT